MIKTILWDIDGTILDFHSSAENSLKNTFKKFGYGEITAELLHMYEGINDVYWRKLEKGEITKEKLLVERFVEFFRKIGIENARAKEFNQAYLNGLLDTIVFMPEAYETVKKLHLKYKQYIVTNGVKQLQHKKISKAKIEEFFDDIFISDEIGYEKPQIEFFNHVFDRIEPQNRDEVIIIGDSLTSDIAGGIRSGIHTCWYHPSNEENHSDIKPECTVTSHLAFQELLKQL